MPTKHSNVTLYNTASGGAHLVVPDGALPCSGSHSSVFATWDDPECGTLQISFDLLEQEADLIAHLPWALELVESNEESRTCTFRRIASEEPPVLPANESPGAYWALEPTEGQRILAKMLQTDAPVALEPQALGSDGKDYPIVGGIALISIKGPMTKGSSYFSYFFGGCSTQYVRYQLRMALADPDVKGVMLRIDSPGGSTSGTDDLAKDIAMVNASKPVHAYIEDCGCSAAYWAACAARTISINPTGMAGSIGTYLWLVDSSKAYEEIGFKVLLIATGEYKGAGVPGVEITTEQQADFRRVVDKINSHFLKTVQKGRKMTAEQVKEVATGQVWIGDEAKALGLVDRVCSFDEAMAQLMNEAKPTRSAIRSEQPISSESNPLTGQTIAEESEAARIAVGGLIKREASICAMRKEQGRRPLSSAAKSRIEDTADFIEAQAHALRDLLNESDEPAADEAELRLRLKLALA